MTERIYRNVAVQLESTDAGVERFSRDPWEPEPYVRRGGRPALGKRYVSPDFTGSQYGARVGSFTRAAQGAGESLTLAGAGSVPAPATNSKEGAA